MVFLTLLRKVKCTDNGARVLVRTFVSNDNSAKIGLAKVVPSSVSVVAAAKKKKQAITNVLFSFLTCVLGAQVIKYRYMKDDAESELNELRRKFNEKNISIEKNKILNLCDEMNANEKQKNILLNYFVNNNDIDNDLDNKRDGCGIEEMKNDDTGDELNGAKNEKKLKNFRI